MPKNMDVMMHNRFTTITVLILVIFISIPAYPMLILKQEKKHSPAYLCIRERKIKKDPLIPQQEKREVFDTIITFGKVVLQNSGTIIKTVETITTMVIANIATQIVTGKTLDQFRREHEKRHGYNNDESRREREEIERQKDFDARRVYDVSMTSAWVWNSEKGYFVDCDGNILHIVGGSSEKPETNNVYSGLSLPIINVRPKDESIVSSSSLAKTSEDSPEMPQSIREVDYENNPADKAWLEDFAKKICPSGGYTIGDITNSSEYNDEMSIYHSLSPEMPYCAEVASYPVSLENGPDNNKQTVIVEDTPVHPEVPNYSSGERIANWQNAQPKGPKKPKNKKPKDNEDYHEIKEVITHVMIDQIVEHKLHQSDPIKISDKELSIEKLSSDLPATSIPQQVAYVIPQESSVTYGPSPASRLFNALSESYNSGIIGRLLAISSVSDNIHRSSTSLSLEERMSDSRSKPVFNNPNSTNYSPFRPSSSSQFPFHGGQKAE